MPINAPLAAGSRAAADLVVIGARIQRPSGSSNAGSSTAGPPADGIAVRAGQIMAIGAAADVLTLAGRGTRVVHAPGRLVIPGFQDSHVHTPFAGRNRLQVWLNDASGLPAYLDVVAAHAGSNLDQPWVLGGGWAMEHFPGGTPRKEDLDRVVPDRPVFLFNRDVHGAWVNSRTLELAGITADTPDPADGRIERDPVTGEPTGTLHEGAAYRVNDTLVPVPDQAGWQAAVLEGQRHLHSFGITGWQDAWVTPATVATYRTLAENGRLTGRVVGAMWWDRDRGLDQVPDFVAQRQQTLDAARSGVPGSGVPGFFPTSVKIMTDGVLENHSGALLEPYCDGCGGHTDNRGICFVEPELLTAAVTELDRLGFQVHMHAIGDRAVRNALDAIAAARAANGMNDLRHHIAHLQVVHPDDVPRFAALRVVANCQTYWAQSEPQMDELTIPFLGPERAAQQYPFESLRRAGARLAMGSDWAVTTANPLEQLEVAVTRIDPENRDTPAFLPEQRLRLTDAFAAFTAGSAYVNHDDADAGMLEIARRADLALLSDDIFRSDGTSGREVVPLADVRVELTVATGRVVHDTGL